MTNSIPQAAIDAAAEALYQCETGLGTDSWNRAFEVERSLWRDQAHAILEAAMPHIRKQIAEEIRAELDDPASHNPDEERENTIFNAGQEYAARIAEGVNK